MIIFAVITSAYDDITNELIWREDFLYTTEEAAKKHAECVPSFDKQLNEVYVKVSEITILTEVPQHIIDEAEDDYTEEEQWEATEGYCLNCGQESKICRDRCDPM
jgi:hypothetical protein